MAHWFKDNVEAVGRTPLVRLNRLQAQPRVRILAKIEGRNPAYSVKCRLGAALVRDAEARGLLGPQKEIVEPTSGNTGIALAFVAAARGYREAAAYRQEVAREMTAVAIAEAQRAAREWLNKH